MTDTAQPPKNTNSDASGLSQQTINPSHTQQALSGALPHKEHAPVEHHVRTSDPLETQPELHPEVKEHGVEVRQDEAKLELTREHYQAGISHAPSSQTVTDHLKDEKSEFPMTHVEVEENRKKSPSFSMRWLAEEILKAMKGPKKG